MQIVILGVLAIGAMAGMAGAYQAGDRGGAARVEQAYRNKIDAKNAELDQISLTLKAEQEKAREVRTEIVKEFVTKEVPVIKNVVQYKKAPCDLSAEIIAKLNGIK